MTGCRHDEIIRTLGQRIGISVRYADIIVGGLIKLVAENLAAGRPVDLRGFGSFELRTWKARINPTLGGGRKRLPQRQFVRFVPCSSLKASVRKVRRAKGR